MATFILVHGAWHGGWAWRRAVRLLRRDGYDVYAPSLTGLGDRSHLLAPNITLSMHVRDITNLIANEELSDVVLCGHSHQQSVVHGPGGCLILNPGSVGCPVFADIPIAANLEYRSPHARYAVLTKRNGNWRAELLALEYDWASASACALENGRPEWAMALSSGVVG